MTSMKDASDVVDERKLMKSIFDPSDDHNDLDYIYDDLLETFGSLGRLLSASPEKIRAISTIPDVVVSRIILVKDVFLHVLKTESYESESMSTVESIRKYMRFKLRCLDRENFIVFYMNARNQILLEEVTAIGTVNEVKVYPREIIRVALSVNATAIILVHNHPSGCCRPSQNDINFTRELNGLCDQLGLTLHDHLIIGLTGESSLRREKFF